MNDWKITQSPWYGVPQPVPKHLIIAKKEVGVKEATRQNDGIPSTRYMGGRREPWCAHFIAWIFRQAGDPLPHDVPDVSPTKANPLAGVQFLEDTFKKNKWWFRNGDSRIGPPEAGDVIFYKNRAGSDAGPGRHVGVVERVVGGWIHTIEGNWSDGVGTRRIFLASDSISGFGRKDFIVTRKDLA